MSRILRRSLALRRVGLATALLLLLSGCTPDLVPEDQATLDEALRHASWNNDVSEAASLIAKGANVNAKDATIQSAYLIATSEGYLDLLNLTLDNGAKINDKDSWNGTGLIRAAERGHALIVGRLLQAGIDRDHVNRIGYQAIHEAIWLGRDTQDYADTVRALVAGGAQLTKQSGTEKLTPTEMTRDRGYPILEEILRMAADSEKMANPNEQLLGAAADGDADRVAIALRSGADIEARDSNGRTALLLAATHDRVDVARLLVAMGASADARDNRHDTPWLVTGVTGSVAMVDALLEAVLLGDGGERHQAIVATLLAAGADRSIADRDGVTALEHARTRGYTEIEAILALE